MKYSILVLSLIVGLLIAPSVPDLFGLTTIGPGRILPITPGAGTGTLDYLFFTFSNAERDNCPSPGDGGCAAFDGDNANTEVAGGGDTMFDESYVTSMGEIQDFYLFAFPPPMKTPNEIILFLDINEQGQDTMVDLCDLQINDRDVRESRRVLLPESACDESMQPHGCGRLCFDESKFSELLEILQPCLLPVHAPRDPAADRRQDHRHSDREQAAWGGEPTAWRRCVT